MHHKIQSFIANVRYAKRFQDICFKAETAIKKPIKMCQYGYNYPRILIWPLQEKMTNIFLITSICHMFNKLSATYLALHMDKFIMI